MTHDRRDRAPLRGANDQDKHGRKQNRGSNEDTLRGLGSRRDTHFDGADTPPRAPAKQPRKPSDPH